MQSAVEIGSMLAPALPLAITTLNLLTWRAPRTAAPVPRATALVPARNEAQNIRACVEALLAEPFAEVIVCDDRSTDETGAVLAALAARHPRLRVIRGAPLPEGWVGKPYVCHQLAAAAGTDVLVFVDADTRLVPGALARLEGALDGADIVSALPWQVTGSFAERLVLPLLHLTYLSWLPLRLVRRVRDPRVLACNGQVLVVRRAAYQRMGGFAAVAGEVVDDMAFCRAAKRVGLTVDFVDGRHIALCRMYQSSAEVWAGFSKNLYEGIGGQPIALVAVLGLYVTCFLLPWLLLPFAALPATVGIAANVVQRTLLARRFGHSAWEGVVLHPLSILAFVGLALNSWAWSRRGAIHWRGRTYAPRRAT